MPSNIPLVSIVIVSWQSRDEIGACIRSIPSGLTVDGATGAVEIIVVDNSLNADGTGDLLRREFPLVRYLLPSENLGFGHGNNFGFRESSGECVLFLNPDTICNAAALAHCLARIRMEQDLGLISPKLVLADGSMDLACRRSIPTIWDGFSRGSGLATRFPKTKAFAGYNLTYLPEEGTYGVGAINGAFMLARREVLERVAAPTTPQRVFDERFFMYGDDLDLCIRVAQAGYKIIYDGRVRITHLKGQSVAKDYKNMSAAIFDANRDVYLKHFNPHDSSLIRWKYIVAFGLWKNVAKLRAQLRGHKRVRPL
jgi:GT2 family glycosyltransferase